MKSRPYVLLRTSVLDEVRHRIADAVAVWRADWGMEHLPLEIACERAWEAQPAQKNSQWKRRFSFAGQSIWFAWPSDLIKYVQREMFSPDQRHVVPAKTAKTIAGEAAEECAMALLGKIADAFFSGGAVLQDDGADDFDDPVFARASGAALVNLQLGEHPVVCLLNCACMREIDASLEKQGYAGVPKDALRKSLANVPISLSVEVGRSEVELSSLMSLVCGDVIRLTTPVDRPLSVLGPDGRSLFGAYLGRVDNFVAMEVVRKDQ